jgi:tetratricopeptide (TPR) repeat protein
MGDFDEFPGRGRNHEIEDEALAAFTNRIVESGAFVLQSSDRKDYGADCQLEVIGVGGVTNIRIQAQLKGTEQSLNVDGSVSVEIQRTTLNYLLMQPHSFFACYHLPTKSLRICPVATLLRQYEHSGKQWTRQKTLTVSFRDELTVERLRSIATLAQSGAAASRDSRKAQATALPGELRKTVLHALPEVHVPDDRHQAAALLQELYESNADQVISAGFEKFAAVLGLDDEQMGVAYMSEINLGMAKQSQHLERIEAGIAFFEKRVGGAQVMDASLFYTMANGFSALGNDQAAKLGYQAALADPLMAHMPDLAAQANLNLGTSLARLGEGDAAIEHYQAALKLVPNLPEAHNALGNHFVRIGRYEEALVHFDQAIYVDRYYGKTTSVSGWRANVLFNLGRGREAFREINALVNDADRYSWVWPWTARLVASFGRTSVDNALLARPFWERFVAAHPDNSHGRWELLMSNFYLRGQGGDLGKSYAEFKKEFDRQIVHVTSDYAALLWDRLGHWAEDEDDWTEAERCFRIAYDLEGGDYGYCLGIALKYLDRFDESLPLLLEQARTVQPDAQSWFQVGIVYMKLGQFDEAVEAMRTAIDIDRDYAPAAFELGGLYWNSGKRSEAREMWAEAVNRFPDDELAEQARLLLKSQGAD